VVVIGVGGAGVSACIEAADRGASVLAFDRFGGGGATRKSGARRVWSGIPSTIGESVNVNQPIAGSFNIIVKANQYMRYTS
jgi:3-oxo-5alpha-steroid 4-dehydrogenase